MSYLRTADRMPVQAMAHTQVIHNARRGFLVLYHGVPIANYDAPRLLLCAVPGVDVRQSARRINAALKTHLPGCGVFVQVHGPCAWVNQRGHKGVRLHRGKPVVVRVEGPPA